MLTIFPEVKENEEDFTFSHEEGKDANNEGIVLIVNWPESPKKTSEVQKIYKNPLNQNILVVTEENLESKYAAEDHQGRKENVKETKSLFGDSDGEGTGIRLVV